MWFCRMFILFCFQAMSRKTKRGARSLFKYMTTPSPKSALLIGRKRMGISLFSLCLCLFLTACGFHPMYTPRDGKSDIAYPLKIATISNRNGQVLRNYLVDLLTPEGTKCSPLYILEIGLTEKVKSIGVAKDESSTRKEATLTAAITLRDIRTNKVVYTHTAKAINSFNVISQYYYSDLVTDEYAKRQALRLLAEKITLLLTTYLDTKK